MPRENREYYLNEKTKQQILELQNIVAGKASLNTNEYTQNMFSVFYDENGNRKDELQGDLSNAVLQRNNIIMHTQELLKAFDDAADPNFDYSTLPDFQHKIGIIYDNIDSINNSIDEWSKGEIGEGTIDRAGKQLSVAAKLAGIQAEMIREQNREQDYLDDRHSLEEQGASVQTGLDTEHAEVDHTMRRGMENFYNTYGDLCLRKYPGIDDLMKTENKSEVDLHKDLKKFGEVLDLNIDELKMRQRINHEREIELAASLKEKKETLQTHQDELKALEKEGRDLEGHINDQNYYLDKGYMPKDAESRAMFRAVDTFIKQHEELHQTIADEFNAYLEGVDKQITSQQNLDAHKVSLETKRNVAKKYEEQLKELERQTTEHEARSKELTEELQARTQKYVEAENKKINKKAAKNQEAEHQFGDHTKEVDRLIEIQTELGNVNLRLERLKGLRPELVQNLNDAWAAVKEAEERQSKEQAEWNALNKSNLDAQRSLQEKAQKFGEGYFGIAEDIYKVEALTEEFKQQLQKDIADSKKKLEQNKKAVSNKKADIQRAEREVERTERDLNEVNKDFNNNRYDLNIMEGRAKTDLSARVEKLQNYTGQKHDLERQKIEEQAANEKQLLDLQKKDAENQKKVAQMTKTELLRLSNNIINAKKWGLSGDTTEYADLKRAATEMRDHMNADDAMQYMQNPQFRTDLESLQNYAKIYTQAKLDQHKDGTDRRKNRIDAARDMGEFAAVMQQKESRYFAEAEPLDYEKKLSEIEKRKEDALKKLDEKIKAEKDEIHKLLKPAEKEVKKVSLESIMEEEKKEEAAPKTAQRIPFAKETLLRQQQQLEDFQKRLEDPQAIFNNLKNEEYGLYKKDKLQLKGKEAEFAGKLMETHEALKRETAQAIKESEKLSGLNVMDILDTKRWEDYHENLDKIQKLRNDLFKMKVPQSDMKNKVLRGAATSLFNGANSFENGMSYVDMVDQNIMKIESMPEYGQLLQDRERLAKIDQFRKNYTDKLHKNGIHADAMEVRNDPEGVQKKIADQMKVKPQEREVYKKIYDEQDKALKQLETDLDKAKYNLDHAWIFNKSKRLDEKNLAESLVNMMRKDLKGTEEKIKEFESDEKDSALNKLYEEIPNKAAAFRSSSNFDEEYRQELSDNIRKNEAVLQQKEDQIFSKMGRMSNQRATALGAMDKLVNGLNEEEKRGKNSRGLIDQVTGLRDELKEQVDQKAYDKADPASRAEMDAKIHEKMAEVRKLAKDYIDNDKYAISNANKRALCEAFLYDVDDVMKLDQTEKVMKDELRKTEKSERIMRPDCLRLKKQAERMEAAEERRRQREEMSAKKQNKEQKSKNREKSGNEL